MFRPSPPTDELLRTSYRQRRVLLTGHTGFKGPWFIQWLDHLEAQVAGYALAPPTEPNHYNLAHLDQKLAADYRHDIRDLGSLRRVLREFQPEIIFHMAAKSVVHDCHDAPTEAFEVNAIGTARLLDAIRAEEQPCVVVVVTTDKCYENREQVWGYRECDPLGEVEPYGASKAAAELVVRAYRQSYFPPTQLNHHGVALATARAGNVIGGGDWTPHALVPELIDALTSGREITLRHPSAIRPWQHVLQAISGYLLLGAHLQQQTDATFCDAWNFGPWPGNEWSVSRFVEQFTQRWPLGDRSHPPTPGWIAAAHPSTAHESQILRLSIDKSVALLNWRPTWDTTDSIAATADWYATLIDASEQLNEKTMSQIIQFEQAFFAAVQPPVPLAPAVESDLS